MDGISTGAFEQERDTWSDALRRTRDENWACVELCAILPRLVAALGEYLASDPLADFTRVSVHAPVGIDSPDAAVAELLQLPLHGDVILHPDLYGAADAVVELGERAVFENMDVAKSFGKSVGDLVLVFERFPAAGFCLDVAHVWTNDPTLELGHALIDAFAPRLRQLHVSGIERDGTHRPTTQDDLSIYAPLLERCGHIPHVFETVLL